MTLKPGHEIVIEELVAKAKELNDENKRLRKGIERMSWNNDVWWSDDRARFY